MPLSRTERFKLKSQLLDEMNMDNSGWDLRRTNVLLGEFGLETLDGDWNGPSFEDIIALLPDSDLVEMYSIVTGIKQEEVQDAVESADSGNWKPGYVRLFLSHSARHKKFAGEVADELAAVGIHGPPIRGRWCKTRPPLSRSVPTVPATSSSSRHSGQTQTAPSTPFAAV